MKNVNSELPFQLCTDEEIAGLRMYGKPLVEYGPDSLRQMVVSLCKRIDIVYKRHEDDLDFALGLIERRKRHYN